MRALESCVSRTSSNCHAAGRSGHVCDRAKGPGNFYPSSQVKEQSPGGEAQRSVLRWIEL